jgi:predicted RecA/RadA family phage recombinase
LRTYDVIKFTIKRSTQDSDEGAVWQGSMVAGDIAIDDTITAHNIIDVVVPKEATKDMRSGRVYYWDVTIEDDAGNVFTPLQGTILVTDDVTLG